MTFLPIVARELRVAARRPASYWGRCASVGTAMAFGAFMYLDSMNWPMAVVGQNLFKAVSIFAFFYCMAAGMRFTSDCLSEEKREGTLGLLFLTDLKGYDVVAGKLVATSLNGFYGLVAILPVLAIPLLMGGVTSAELWRMTLALLNTFFLSLAFGMLMSSLCTSSRKSFAGIFLFLVIAPLAMGWLLAYLEDSHKMPRLRSVLFVVNPIISAILAMDPGSTPNGHAIYWKSLGVIHGLAWGCLFLASLIVPRSWQDKPVGKTYVRSRGKLRSWIFGGIEERRLFRRKLLDVNAFFWLCARERFRPLLLWAALLVMAGFWIWGLMDNGREWMDPEPFFLTILTMNVIFKVWVASEAGRRFGEDRKTGALELLLSTLMSVNEILLGQLLAMKRHFLAPLVTMIVAESVYLRYVVVRSMFGPSDSYASTLAFGISMIIFLVVDSAALMLVAMWTSLTTSNPNRTMGITVRKVLLLPMVAAFAPFYVYIALVTMYRGEPSWMAFVSVYIFPSLAADLFFGWIAWWRLQNRFREVATQRFTPKVSFWRRLFGRGAPAGARN